MKQPYMRVRRTVETGREKPCRLILALARSDAKTTVGHTTDALYDCTCTSMRLESVVSSAQPGILACFPERIFKSRYFGAEKWKPMNFMMLRSTVSIRAYLSFNTIPSIADGQQALRRGYLQPLHKKILRVVVADQCADNLADLSWNLEQSSLSAKEARRKLSRCYSPDPTSNGSGSQFGPPQSSSSGVRAPTRRWVCPQNLHRPQGWQQCTF